jgi:hypothetical protein
MVKVKIDNAKGLVQSAGNGVSIENQVTLRDMVWATEAVTGAGALSTTVPVSLIDTTGGAAAITLGDGGVGGQVKFIAMIKDAGDATLTLDGSAAGAGASDTYTFANVGETLLLVWVVDEDGTAVGWAEVSRGSGANAAAGAVAGLPVATTA